MGADVSNMVLCQSWGMMLEHEGRKGGGEGCDATDSEEVELNCLCQG